MREDRKKRNAVIICLLVLMICITGSTYAYYALTASNSTSVTGSVGSTGSLTLTVTKLYSTSSNKMIPQLEASLDRAISGEYNCEDSKGNVICHVYRVKIKNTSSPAKINGTIKFTSMSGLPNLKWKRLDYDNTTSKPIVGNYVAKNASSSKVSFLESEEFTSNQERAFYFVGWIDETGSVQTDNGTYKATIEVDTTEGGLTSTVGGSNGGTLLSDYIISLYNDGSSTTTATVGDGPQTVSLNATQKLMKVNQGDTYGEEYRYYGASPNNYVEYNGELWRIISVSKVFSSESDTTGETRVRIIKDTPLGNYAWDDDSNNWADATLMCQLNTMYYNDTVPACTGKSLTSLTTSLNDEAKSLIDNVLWYLGGGDTSDLYADDYYTMERGTTTYGSNPTRWTGKVGIMYPSDYAYAADLSQCTKTGINYDTDTTNCTGTDWLYNGDYQWLMSPDSGYSFYAWGVIGTGCVLNGDVDVYVVYENGVRPLAVLKSDVTKLEGEGTNGNPYRLGLGT